MNILAIDLGKFNSMCCFFDTTTQKHSFWTAATTRRYMTTLLKQHTIDLVVMEACGPSGWISDLCQELGLETLVCSTNEEAWRWRNVKRKTDKDDALKLARLAMLEQLRPVHIPSPPMREHRTLVKYRKTAEVLVTALDDVDRFANARQVSAYIGLVPRQYQSGETDRKGRITKRGSRLLRTMLLECAWVSLRYNPWARETYDRIHGGQQTRKKKAAIALARKIAVVAWSMLKHETDWDPARMGREAEAKGETKKGHPAKRQTTAAGTADPKRTPLGTRSSDRRVATLSTTSS